jgi:hypothetical protein
MRLNLARPCAALMAACLLALLPLHGVAEPVAPASASASAATASASAPEVAASAAAPASAASAPDMAASAPAAPLDTRVQDLKSEVIALNRDLLVLEEELLYPAGTQVALFVSMDVGKLFELESVQIRLDDKVIASHLYTPLEVQALHRGGMQRIYMGNLKSGKHRITAFFTGQGPHERDYKRGTTLEFDKGEDPRYIELRIEDAQAKLQPEFEVKVWQ